LHFDGIRELAVIPSEVAFAIIMFNIEPNNVIWNIVVIKLVVNLVNVILVDVVPTTLVVGDGEILRHARLTSQASILAENIFASGTKEHKNVQNTSFRDPMCLCALLVASRFDKVEHLLNSGLRMILDVGYPIGILVQYSIYCIYTYTFSLIGSLDDIDPGL
jgi:hypothetical protein